MQLSWTAGAKLTPVGASILRPKSQKRVSSRSSRSSRNSGGASERPTATFSMTWANEPGGVPRLPWAAVPLCMRCWLMLLPGSLYSLTKNSIT
eukprot:scaffold152405_cov55-Prasinocladus_malaysianus.AAC.2